MNPNKIAARLTDEIINEFRLPRTVCYDFINSRMHMGIAGGVNIGRAHIKPKQVVCLKNGKIFKVYESLKQAAVDVDGDSSSISLICLNKTVTRTENGKTRTYKRKMHKGFEWRFVDSNDFYTYRKNYDNNNRN